MAARGSAGFVIGVLKSRRDSLIRGIVRDIVETLASPPEEGGTPRDTGWASSRWVVVVGSAGGPPEPRPQGFTGPADRSEQEQSLNALELWSAEDGPVAAVNLVPYLVILNEGSSSQAPAGFVQAAVAKAVQNRGRAVIS